MKRKIILIIAVMILAGMGIFFGLRQNQSTDSERLSHSTEKTAYQPLEEEALQAVAQFSLNLFKSSRHQENTLISPISLYTVLGLTANGADGSTLEQLEILLAGRTDTFSSINQTCQALMKILPSDQRGERIQLASSVWFRNDLAVHDTFLETSSTFYGAQICRTDFSNARSTAEDMNNWVKKHTDGSIQSIVSPEEITSDLMVSLCSAISFDCCWETEIPESQVYNETFITQNGKEISIPFLHGTGMYLEKEGLYTGFQRLYQGAYTFTGLLPEDGISPEMLAQRLTVKDLQNLADCDGKKALTAFPEWRMEDSTDFQESLKALGLKNFFTGTDADLSKMSFSENSALEVSRLLQQTSLTVTAEGTKAAAAAQEDVAVSTAEPAQPVSVVLNRPFLFLIQHTDSGLPLFIGILNDPE